MKDIVRRIGIDVGASHIAGIIADTQGKIIQCHSILYAKKADQESFILALKEVIDTLLRKEKITISEIEKIGIDLPGNCDGDVLLGAQNMKLEQVNVKKELQQYFDIDVYIQNDAVCALIGELEYGSLKNKKNAILLTMGTATGYAVSLQKEGKIYFVDDETRDALNDFNLQYEKRIKGLEALRRIYAEKIGTQEITRKTIFEDIKKNSKLAQETFDDYIADICIGIKRFSQNLQINCFCIGGGLSEYEEFFIKEMKKQLPELEICICQYKNYAGAIGATLLPYEVERIKFLNFVAQEKL